MQEINYDNVCDSAIRAITKVLPRNRYSYLKVYNSKALEILSTRENEATRLYIRIIYIGDNKFAVDLSSITLDIRIRRKGIFTSIVNNIKASRLISQLWVSSVLTEEMHMACRRVNMCYDETIMGYKLIL